MGDTSQIHHRASLLLIVAPAQLLIIAMVLFLMTSVFLIKLLQFPVSMKTDTAKRVIKSVFISSRARYLGRSARVQVLFNQYSF